MVCLCLAGGGLNDGLERQLSDAALLFEQSDYGAAATLYRQILEQSPRHCRALYMLGQIAQRTGNATLALTLFEEALAAEPDFAPARYHRSVALRSLGRPTEALQAARMAIDTAPDLAEAWDLVGQLSKDQGDFTGATKAFAHALLLQPHNAQFHDHYALLLYMQGAMADAYRAARLAFDLDMTHPPLLLGNILVAMGYPALAADAFACARALRPDFSEVVANEAMARLQTGDFAQGWPLWEQRPDWETSLHAIPLWDGKATEHLFVYEDQGLGDAIQFMRYLPLLKKHAARLSLRVRAPLQRLAAENFPDIDHIISDDMPVTATARCQLASLPALFRTELSSIPATPYLKAAPALKSEWRTRLTHRPGPRIGLVWAGNPQFHQDAARSLALDMLRPLLAAYGSHFVSLQKNQPEAADILARHSVFDAALSVDDFADTAAVIENLDLVISVDTATAHLAGALGKPVFLLLPFSADWRWLLGREDSPWYASARLFRQQKPGDWAGVIEKISAELDKLIAGDHSVLQAKTWPGPCLRQHPNALTLPP